MSKVKHFTSSVFIFYKFNTEYKLLLLLHKKFQKWMIPGGHVEINENLFETAIREVKEETGLQIKPISFIHHYLEGVDSKWVLPPEYMYQQLIPASSKEDEHYHIDCAYVAFAKGLTGTTNADESQNIQWVTLEEVLTLDMFSTTKNLAETLLDHLANDTIIYSSK